MKDDFENVYDMIEHAIELAFVGKMQLKFYEFLKYRKTTRAEVDAFLKSSTATELANEVVELQAYGHISKPQARKIKAYLGGILEDAVRYSNDRRPGRKKKNSK